MVAMSSSTAALLFWSWVNQSQNALVNYYNRNACSKVSTETLPFSYFAAVGSALAVVFGLCSFIQGHYSDETAHALLRFVAFPSAVVASSLNCYIARRPEIACGIPLLDLYHNNVLPGETSTNAVTLGVYSTTASRALLQLPTYFARPLIVETVTPLEEYLVANPAATVPLTTFWLLLSFGIGLPAAVGVFPQMSKLDATQVEHKFRELRDPQTGEPYTQFWFNKGS